MKAQTFRDALGAGMVRRVAMVMLGAQIIVGQALPLSASRPLNAVAQSALDMFSWHAAEIVAWVLGSIIMCCAFARRAQLAGAILYGLYTAIIARSAFRLDPYVAGLYVIYAIFGLMIAASAVEVRRKHDAA